MKYGMVLLLVFLGIGLTGSAQANEIDYWEGNMQVGNANFPPFAIPCPTDQNLPPNAEQCQREFVVFEIHHNPIDQMGGLIVWSYSYSSYFNPGTQTRGYWDIGGPYSVQMTIAPQPFASRMTDIMRFDGVQITPGVADGVYGSDWLGLTGVFGETDPGIMPAGSE